MYQNLKKHACGYCNFSTSRKFNLDRHFKRKHQNQHHPPVQARQLWTQQQGERLHALNQKHDQKYVDQGIEMPIVYQQPEQEQQKVKEHPLDLVHLQYTKPVVHQPVQAQQGLTQQQSERVYTLCPKHKRKHAEVIYQTY